MTVSNADIIAELTRAKCLFQLRAIATVIGTDPSDHPPRDLPNALTAAAGVDTSFHANGVAS